VSPFWSSATFWADVPAVIVCLRTAHSRLTSDYN
jgi:hypothetical protein